MKKLFALCFVAVSMMVTMAVASLTPVAAQNLYAGCENANVDRDNPICSNRGADATDTFKNVINVILTILGIVSVIMIVVGGFQYTTSGGDSNKVAAAKNTILYAVIGVVVALLAAFIVQYVVNNVK